MWSTDWRITCREYSRFAPLLHAMHVFMRGSTVQLPADPFFSPLDSGKENLHILTVAVVICILSRVLKRRKVWFARLKPDKAFMPAFGGKPQSVASVFTGQQSPLVVE